MSLSVWQRWLKQSFPSAQRPARTYRPTPHCRLRVEALEDRVVPNNAPVINDQTFALNENSPVGTVIGTVAASDPDPGQSLTYSVIGINPGDAFALDPDTGVLSVANNSLLDFESHPTFSLMVRVLDDGVPAAAAQATIHINLIDVNEAPTLFSQAFNISRGVPVGTAVGTVQASDPDQGQALTFTITAGNSAGAFAINSASGQITVANAAALAALAGPVGLTVQATDSGFPALAASATVTVTPVGVTGNNHAPNIGGQAFSISRQAAFGSVVGTVQASDPDPGQSLNYAITFSSAPGAFALNPGNGQLTVLGNLLGLASPVTMTVQVLDNGIPALSASATVTVTLSDTTPGGNHAPVIGNQTFLVDPATPVGTAIGTVMANDPDPGQSLTYAITFSSAPGAIALNSGNGQLTVASGLQGITSPITMTVQVSDSGSPQMSAVASVSVVLATAQNVNHSPVIGNQSFSVSRSAPVGTLVGTVQATDPDPGQTLNYTITAGNAAGAFAINAGNGQITVANAAALAAIASPATLTVTVTDSGSPHLAASATVTVTLTQPGTNHLPVIGNQSFTADRASPVGAAVGTVVASDPDAGQSLTYAITGSTAPGAFAINPTTGQLTVAAGLTALSSPVGLIVQVTDSGTPTLSAAASVIITLTTTPITNHVPVIGNQSFSVSRAAAAGAPVGTVQASDPDAGQTLAYAITAGNAAGAFAINAGNGQITVANAAALANLPSSNPLTVTVTDNGSPQLSAAATVTVTLTAAVNHAPVIGNQTFTADRSAPVGAVVGTVVASDPDAGQSLTYSIVASTAPGAFAINAATGQLTVAAGLQGPNSPVTLIVMVTDSGSPALSTAAAVAVTLTNTPVTNHAPVIHDQSFTVSRAAATGATVGTVAASDPDAGQHLTYSITAGNGAGAFAIDPATGRITVADAAALANLPSSNPLTVQVTDNGSPQMSAAATVTINVAAVINRKPVNHLPGPLTACEDVPLVIQGISVTVADGGAAGRMRVTGKLRVTLSVVNGVLFVRPDVRGGVSWFGISGDLTRSVTLTGTPAQVNATLAAGVIYLGKHNFSGTDTLTMTSKDLVSGLSDTDKVSITVRSAQQQAADLQKMVEKLRDTGVLSKSDAQSLLSLLKLPVGGHGDDDDDRDDAVGNIRGFIKKVKDLLKAHKLTQAQAQPLLDTAACLLLSCY